MKVQVVSGRLTCIGYAPDDAPAMLAAFASVMLGCVCYEIKPDGRHGRSIDPQWVKVKGAWILGEASTEDQTASRKIAEQRWLNFFAPLRSARLARPGEGIVSAANTCDGCGEPAEYDDDGKLIEALHEYENGNGTKSTYHPLCWVEMMDSDVCEEP